MTPENETQLVQLQWLLSCFRAQHWSYQESHWRASGPTYYGDHLLFERLYNSIGADMDTLAEKMVAMFGGSAVATLALAPKSMYWLEKWAKVSCLHERGMLSERCFLSCCRRTYDLLKAANALTLGMDDFLMATSSAHETNLYLLQQVLRTTVKEM